MRYRESVEREIHKEERKRVAWTHFWFHLKVHVGLGLQIPSLTDRQFTDRQKGTFTDRQDCQTGTLTE